ncbi:MAG TPA: TfoX/Sxy family protein [Longimicrobiales bacterium]
MYDEGLLERCLDCLNAMGLRGFRHKNVFGMRGLLLDKRMFAAVGEDAIIVKLTSREFPRALAQPGIARFMPGGQTLGYWVSIEAAVVADDPELRDWLAAGLRGIS